MVYLNKLLLNSFLFKFFFSFYLEFFFNLTDFYLEFYYLNKFLPYTFLFKQNLLI